MDWWSRWRDNERIDSRDGLLISVLVKAEEQACERRSDEKCELLQILDAN